MNGRRRVQRQAKLKVQAEVKEVYINATDSVSLPVYTIPKAAQALGKTQITFKRWIKDQMLPPPIFKDTVKGFNHYSEGELQLIADIMVEHFREYDYFHATHTHTVERLWQAIEGYRRN